MSNLQNTAHQASENPLNTTVNPAPVGLLCHALTATVFGVFLLHGSMNGIAAPMSIGFGGLLTMLSGLFEYTRGRTFSFTYLVGLGCFWMCFGIFNTLSAAQPSMALTFGFALWAVVAIAFLYPAFYMSRSGGIFILSWVLFALITAYHYIGGGAVWLAAISAFFTAFMGYYKAYAYLALFAYQREILPLGRRGHDEPEPMKEEVTF